MSGGEGWGVVGGGTGVVCKLGLEFQVSVRISCDVSVYILQKLFTGNN